MTNGGWFWVGAIFGLLTAAAILTPSIIKLSNDWEKVCIEAEAKGYKLKQCDKPVEKK